MNKILAKIEYLLAQPSPLMSNEERALLVTIRSQLVSGTDPGSVRISEEDIALIEALRPRLSEFGLEAKPVRWVNRELFLKFTVQSDNQSTVAVSSTVPSKSTRLDKLFCLAVNAAIVSILLGSLLICLHSGYSFEPQVRATAIQKTTPAPTTVEKRAPVDHFKFVPGHYDWEKKRFVDGYYIYYAFDALCMYDIHIIPAPPGYYNELEVRRFADHSHFGGEVSRSPECYNFYEYGRYIGTYIMSDYWQNYNKKVNVNYFQDVGFEQPMIMIAYCRYRSANSHVDEVHYDYFDKDGSFTGSYVPAYGGGIYPDFEMSRTWKLMKYEPNFAQGYARLPASCLYPH